MTADWEQLGANALTPWQEAIVELHERLSKVELSGSARREPAPLLKREVALLVPRLRSIVSYFEGRQRLDVVLRRNSNSSMACDCALAIRLLEAFSDHVVS